MKNSLINLLVLLMITTVCQICSAQVTVIEGKDIEPRDKQLGHWGQVYRISITPAAEAVPAFKHRLTVQPHLTIPGNAITHYLRSFGESSLNGPWETARDLYDGKEHEWYLLETNAKDIPLDELKKASALFDSYIDNHIRRATQCRDADWGLAIEDLRGPETIGFLLPSVQQTRSIARALMLRNRLAVIEGRYEDSVDHIRMTYQLSQNVNDLGFLVANLVAAAETRMANECMIDLISAKDSPNMYWALAELPRPILSFRRALRLESSWPERIFPSLEGVETAEFSKDVWKRQLNLLFSDFTQTYNSFSSANNRKTSPLGESLSLGAALVGYSSAKQRLIESGMDADKVKRMPIAQVLMIDAARDCDYFMGEVEKTFYVPYKDVDTFDNAAENLLREQEQVPTRIGAMLVSMLSPAVAQVHQAEIRVQAEIDALMIIEAIRHHAATEGGLPPSLDDLKLPIRNNPMTDTPFAYQVKNETATLDIPIRGHWKRFEISIAK